MNRKDKAKAFDALKLALTNQWHDGHWTWWCCDPSGGDRRDSREEAIADLVEWAKKIAERKRRRGK